MNDCDEMRLLVQADVDGELTPAEAARVGAHLEQCDACAEAQTELLALSERVRSSAPRYPASEELEAAVRSRLAQVESPSPQPRKWVGRAIGFGRSFGSMPAFGGGFATAACLALLILSPLVLLPRADGPSEAVVGAHIRALQPGHLMDVASTDQHTVKPWFDGRLPFAPPVKDLKSVGFPLTGGRLDYLAGHLAAALVYRRGAHDINLFVWPDDGVAERGPASGDLEGYNFRRWRRDGMIFWAVSDLNARDLDDFVERWRAL